MGTSTDAGAVGRLRTDVRIVQRADEPVNLMILESLSELSSSIQQLLHTLRYAGT
jgi:hypothetical protein